MKRTITVVVERLRRIEIRGWPAAHAPPSTTDPACRSDDRSPQIPKGEEALIRTILKTLLSQLILFAASASLLAQQPAPFVGGLIAPVETAFTQQGNLLVSEAGNGPNSGRLSLVDRTTRTRRTLVDGLPSAIFAGGNGENSPSGPAGLAIAGSIVYVTITNGDSVLAGPIPGTEVPNPTPSSPILSSLLAISSQRPLDLTSGGFTLLPSHHARLKSGETVTLSNGTGESMTVRLVVDFPNFSVEPRPDFPQNVRLSNPFGVVAVGQTLYVVDASQNLIRRVDANSGEYTTLTAFGKIANPTPVGPPFIDAVPNSLRLRGNDLLVTTLTGFPFPAGAAEVRRVDRVSGANEAFVGGLSSAIDSAPLGDAPQSPLLTLEFSVNMTQQAPGRLRVVQPGGAMTTIADNLITPTSVLVDRRNGDIFVTLLGPGVIRLIDDQAFVPRTPAGSILPVVGSTAGAHGARFRSSAQITNPNPFAISGRFVFHPVGIHDPATDRALTYALTPFQTRTYADLAASATASGIGSMDVIPAAGPVPVTVIRVVDDASPCEPAVLIPQVARESAIGAGASAALISGGDGERFNIGVRALEEGASLTMTLYDSSGVQLATATKSLAADELLHQSAALLLGVAVPANASIVFKIDTGSAIVYGSAVDNEGKGMTLQVASAAN